MYIAGMKYRVWSRKTFSIRKRDSTLHFILFVAFLTNTLVSNVAHSSGPESTEPGTPSLFDKTDPNPLIFKYRNNF